MNTRVEPLRTKRVGVVITLLGLLVMLMPMTAFGTHVEPQLITGNEDCNAATGLQGLTKFEPVSSGTQDGVTIVVDGDTFNWSSTVEIAAVFVKGGPDGNLYDYRPDGALSDTGLHAPVNPANDKFYGLSHITFCVPDEEPPPESGWACIDGDVLFEEDREDFPEGTTIYDTEEEAAADENCQDAPLPDRFVCDTETFEIVTVEPGDEGYEDAFDTEEEALAESDGCVEVLGGGVTTSTTAPAVQVPTTAPAVQVPTTAEVLDTEVEAEELPFTGIDSELLVGMAVLLLAGGLALLGVTGKREDA